MRGKYFRYLFENPGESLLHTGSIFDKETQISTNFVYMAGGHCRNTSQARVFESYEGISEKIDVLVAGAYSAGHIGMLIGLLKSHKVKKIILPYLAPIQRLVLLEEIREMGFADKDVIRFLQDPYQFLKEHDIKEIYFLFRNGELISRRPEELEHAACFEQIDAETFQIIRRMEGYAVPVVRAGYMIENGVLFYFGVYGLDIQVLSDFTKEYFSHMENIHEISENASEDYVSQMKRLIQEYLRKFGNSPATSVVMFAGLLHTSPVENNIFMTHKEFSRNAFGHMRETCRKEENCSCVIRCSYGRDHDVLQRYKVAKGEGRFGVWILGNVNLNRYLFEICKRFQKVIPRVRAIIVPNLGNGEEWNHQILKLFDDKDRIYWICSKNDMTSAGVVSDIVFSSPNYRFCPLDKKWGCCLSGYMLPKEDIR